MKAKCWFLILTKELPTTVPIIPSPVIDGWVTFILSSFECKLRQLCSVLFVAINLTMTALTSLSRILLSKLCDCVCAGRNLIKRHFKILVFNARIRLDRRSQRCFWLKVFSNDIFCRAINLFDQTRMQTYHYHDYFSSFHRCVFRSGECTRAAWSREILGETEKKVIRTVWRRLLCSALMSCSYHLHTGNRLKTVSHK